MFLLTINTEKTKIAWEVTDKTAYLKTLALKNEVLIKLNPIPCDLCCLS